MLCNNWWCYYETVMIRVSESLSLTAFFQTVILRRDRKYATISHKAATQSLNSTKFFKDLP